MEKGRGNKEGRQECGVVPATEKKTGIERSSGTGAKKQRKDANAETG